MKNYLLVVVILLLATTADAQFYRHIFRKPPTIINSSNSSSESTIVDVENKRFGYVLGNCAKGDLLIGITLSMEKYGSTIPVLFVNQDVYNKILLTSTSNLYTNVTNVMYIGVADFSVDSISGIFETNEYPFTDVLVSAPYYDMDVPWKALATMSISLIKTSNNPFFVYNTIEDFNDEMATADYSPKPAVEFSWKFIENETDAYLCGYNGILEVGGGIITLPHVTPSGLPVTKITLDEYNRVFLDLGTSSMATVVIPDSISNIDVGSLVISGSSFFLHINNPNIEVYNIEIYSTGTVIVHAPIGSVAYTSAQQLADIMPRVPTIYVFNN